MKRILILFQDNVFVRNSVVLFSGTIIVGALNYLFHLVIGRLVTPQVYGEIESLISLFTIVSVPSAALTLIATKYGAMAKGTDDGDHTRSVFLYLQNKILYIGIPVLLLLLIFGTPIVKAYLHIENNAPIYFLWGALFLSFLSALVIGLLNGLQMFGAANAVGISGGIVKFSVGILSIWLGYRTNGVMGSLVVSAIVGYFVALLHLKSHFKKKSERGMTFDRSALNSFVLPALVGTAAITILGNVDMVFAKHSLLDGASGEYGALSVASKMIFFLTGVFSTVMFAMAAEKSGESEKESRKVFLHAFFLTLLAVVGSIAFFAIFPQFVISVMFGSKYADASRLLPWFALSAGLYSLGNLFLQYFLSLHKSTIAYVFLALAGLEALTLFLFGKDIYAIIAAVIAIQSLALLSGILVFFLRPKTENV
ncbi:MAG: oligosaccharide flippase family protein [Candidatus Moranbacteria bacterium]|nr:oligosaccharide flippase family protein [Candidatus Moranbacteria bacterium]